MSEFILGNCPTLTEQVLRNCGSTILSITWLWMKSCAIFFGILILNSVIETWKNDTNEKRTWCKQISTFCKVRGKGKILPFCTICGIILVTVEENGSVNGILQINDVENGIESLCYISVCTELPLEYSAFEYNLFQYLNIGWK